MKLKRIAALCKKEKRAIIYQKWENEFGTGRTMTQQFISNGFAVYAAHGLPPLEKETLLRIFDVAEDKFDAWHVSTMDLPESVNLSDLDYTEEKIAGTFPSIFLYGTAMQAFGTADNGVIFIRDDYLGPLDGETGLSYYVRSTEGMNYLVVKSGLFLQSVILPERFITKNFFALLKELTFRAGKQLIQDSIPNYKLTIDQMDNHKWTHRMDKPAENSTDETAGESQEEQLTMTPEEENP